MRFQEVNGRATSAMVMVVAIAAALVAAIGLATPAGAAAGPPCCDHVVYSESFESGSGGWTFSTDTARKGHFSVGVPQGTYAHRDRVAVQPDHVLNGSRAVISDPRAGSSVGSHDIDGGSVIAVSPEIEVPDGAQLSMDWFWGHASRSDRSDEFTVTVESATSNHMETVVTHADNGVRAGQWETTTFDLSGFADDTIRIRVVASDVGAGSLSEAGFDNIIIATDPTSVGVKTVLWTQNFESDATVDLLGDAKTGTWSIGAPEATEWSGQPLQQGAASEGVWALTTDGRAGGRTGAHDVDGGSVIARIEVPALPETVLPSEYTLSFDWYLAHLENATAADGLSVIVTGSESELVTIALDMRGTSSFQNNLWKTAKSDITHFKGQEMTITITATDDAAAGALIEAGIDNMVITNTSYPTDPSVAPIAPEPIVTVLPIDPPVAPIAPEPIVTVLPIDPPVAPIAPEPIVTVLPIDPPVAPPTVCLNDGWTAVGGERFNMELPPKMVDQDPQGIDSYIGLYIGDGLRVSFDLGWYSNDLSHLNDEVRPVMTNDVPGLVRFEAGDPNKLGVYYADLDPFIGPEGPLPTTGSAPPPATDHLNVVVSFDDPNDHLTAECILGSIGLGERLGAPQPIAPGNCVRTDWFEQQSSIFTVNLPPEMQEMVITGFDVEVGAFFSHRLGMTYQVGEDALGLEDLDDEIFPVVIGDVPGTLRFEAAIPAARIPNRLGVYFADPAANFMVEFQNPIHRPVAECIINSLTWR